MRREWTEKKGPHAASCLQSHMAAKLSVQLTTIDKLLQPDNVLLRTRIERYGLMMHTQHTVYKCVSVCVLLHFRLFLQATSQRRAAVG